MKRGEKVRSESRRSVCVGIVPSTVDFLPVAVLPFGRAAAAGFLTRTPARLTGVGMCAKLGGPRSASYRPWFKGTFVQAQKAAGAGWNRTQFAPGSSRVPERPRSLRALNRFNAPQRRRWESNPRWWICNPLP